MSSLPERSTDTDTTTGVYIASDGEEHQIGSGEHSYYRETQEELARLKIAPATVFTATHVETKLAAMLRHSDNETHVSVYINNRNGPCPRKWGCDKLVPLILRPDQSITVYWPDGGTIQHKTYHGRRP